MHDTTTSSLTYAVMTDELDRAARAVELVTSAAQDAVVAGLPGRLGGSGDGLLDLALREFCTRWDRGLSALVDDSAAMTQRLSACADSYIDEEDDRVGAVQRLLSCAPPPTQPLEIREPSGTPRLAPG